MRLTPRQLPTTAPHPPVTTVRCMGRCNPQNPRPSVRPSRGADGVQNAYGGAGWHAEWQATPIRRGRVAAATAAGANPCYLAATKLSPPPPPGHNG